MSKRISKETAVEAVSVHYEMSKEKAEQEWNSWYSNLPDPAVFSSESLPAKFLWETLHLEPEDLDLSLREQIRARRINSGWEIGESGVPDEEPLRYLDGQGTYLI